MLKPALLYKDEVIKKHIECWYQPRTQYYSGGYNISLTIENNNGDKRQFASIGSNGSVIGYISYNIDWSTRSATNWGMISFDKGNTEFIKDLYRAAYQVLCVEKFNRMDWWCFSDNPAIKGYCNFVKRIGGGIVGEYHQSNMFPDGSLHDCTLFEIMQKDVNHGEFNKIISRINRTSYGKG